MAIEIPSSLVEFILLGPQDDRRQLQDSPILGDVWVEFAKKPDQRLDLLITPIMTHASGKVAAAIDDRFIKLKSGTDPNIAYLQGIIAAHFTFEELLLVVVPITEWWAEKRKINASANAVEPELGRYDSAEIARIIQTVIESARHWHEKADLERPENGKWPRELTSLDRYLVLTGLILWAGAQEASVKKNASSADKIDDLLKRLSEVGTQTIAGGLNRILETTKADADNNQDPLVWHVSLNRTANPALGKSVAAVKADAAKTLFKVDCSGITWAVIDSGIDGSHPAFAKGAGHRIRKSFDFSKFRTIVSLSNSDEGTRRDNVDKLLATEGLKLKQTQNLTKVRKEADKALKQLAEDAKSGRAAGAIHWELVERLVEIEPTTTPPTSHGTHVAGIIGARANLEIGSVGKSRDINDGMCPDINLYDFRVLGPSTKDTEFAIIGVLQYIRYLNDRDYFLTIHGANLSLSIPHDVRNFACGRTPICNECERLVESGVVVVAAAGNHGYKSFETKEGAYESYAAFSITDPGNADDVITVGATHRYWPHTYGVSFFSSRGPTGDGRLKPDLVAPGERIRAPILKGGWGDLDGTSMAAPHVSGAAAMLMARYSELIGQPSRVKRILCESATDLGRERSFQGHGMLDVLRAFQSI
jgi:serine protease AprX